MKLRFLGAHNCESRRAKMAAFVVNDSIAVDAGGLTSSLSFAAQNKLKAVLLTHQHYDHVRDLPALAMNFFLRRQSLSVYSTLPVFNALRASLFNGSLYPDFFEPREGHLVLTFCRIEPYETVRVSECLITAIPVSHAVPAVGFQITGDHGESLFYTGDTGPGLYETWRHTSPQLLIVELTLPNRYSDRSREPGHLTPDLLRGELLTFKEIKGYLPRVITLHMDATLESEIAGEINLVAKDLRADITMAYEGAKVDL